MFVSNDLRVVLLLLLIVILVGFIAYSVMSQTAIDPSQIELYQVDWKSVGKYGEW